MFEDMLGEAREVRAEAGWTPAIDVRRDDGKLIVRADVPGIKPEEIKVEIAGNTLTLSGQHEATEEETGRDFVRRERRYGSFRRSIAIPPEIDPDTIEAVTHDGVLEVAIPLPESEQPTRKTITPTAV